MEKFNEITKEKSYSEQLEERLSAGSIVDRLLEEFDVFVDRRKIKGEEDQDILQKIKIFLHKNEDLVRNICQDSLFDQWNCLTLSTLACLMAARKGVETTLGKPKNISERFTNTVLIKKNGDKFQLVKSEMESTELVKMDVDGVAHRFARYRPLVKLGQRGCEELAEIFPNELPKMLKKKMNKPTRSRH